MTISIIDITDIELMKLTSFKYNQYQLNKQLKLSHKQFLFHLKKLKGFGMIECKLNNDARNSKIVILTTKGKKILNLLK